MDAGTVINLGLFVLTGISTIFAGYQAVQARRARADAEAARDGAAEAEAAALAAAERSAGAQEQSASALQRQTELAEDEARKQVQWEARNRSGERWEIVNLTGHIVQAFLTIPDSEKYLQVFESGEDDDYVRVDPGGGLELTWPNRFSMPRYAQVVVVWIDVRSGSVRNELVTLDRTPPMQIF